MPNEFIYTPNFTPGRNGHLPIAIVIHIMEGTLRSTCSWFSNPISKVSSHYSIGACGNVIQHVEETDTAWHAGRIDTPSWKLLIPSATQAGEFLNPNMYTVGIEHEGWADSVWTQAMYNSSSKLIAEISLRWSIMIDRDHIIGHNEIFALKTCPGKRVDIQLLIFMANQIKIGNSI